MENGHLIPIGQHPSAFVSPLFSPPFLSSFSLFSPPSPPFSPFPPFLSLTASPLNRLDRLSTVEKDKVTKRRKSCMFSRAAGDEDGTDIFLLLYLECRHQNRRTKETRLCGIQVE